jgi:hypothetical protein
MKKLPFCEKQLPVKARIIVKTMNFEVFSGQNVEDINLRIY